MPRPPRIPQTGEVRPRVVAHLFGVDATDMAELLPLLYDRGFPRPEPLTGHFDIEAVQAWRRNRHPGLLAPPARPANDGPGTNLTNRGTAEDARAVFDRIKANRNAQG